MSTTTLGPKIPGKFRVWAAVLAASVVSFGLRAQSVVLSNFSSTTGLSLNGNTATASTGTGTVLRLVSATGNQAGSAFTTTQRNVSSFSTAFQFRLTNLGGITDAASQVGADGFVFVLQRTSATSVGSLGQGLGYSGIGLSVGVEFDTYMNSGEVSTNHLGIDKNGSISSLAGTAVNVATPFDDGNLWTAWIDYDGTTLEVRANQTGVRPATSLLSYSLNLTDSSYLNGTSAYIGFTAGTGGGWENHDILNWTYSDTYVSGGVSPGSAVPEPTTWTALAGAAALALAASRRRQRNRS